MTRDRRKNNEPNQENVGKILNRKQLNALRECQYFGWKLKFVRSPLFQDPVPVLYNDRIDKIGILDPDGNINMDLELQIRNSESRPEQIKQAQAGPKQEVAMGRNERRKHKVPLPSNLDELINPHQKRALRHIEKFGWQLHFVRKSLFQAPLIVIISAEGDRFATLEHDGRINMTSYTELRKETPVEKTASASSVPASEVKRTK
jgi:hypothetical protein